jgi:integrase
MIGPRWLVHGLCESERAEGVHGKIVQERLGHANIAMTLELSSHVTADMQRHAADTLEATIASAEQRSA